MSKGLRHDAFYHGLFYKNKEMSKGLRHDVFYL